jgi:ketosteroid isomerase-like protein
MAPSTPPAVARRYADAVSAKDFAAIAGLFADDVVWHQPGANRLSGSHRGAAAVGEMLGATMTLSEGTFELTLTGAPMVNGSLAAFPVHFAARRAGAVLAMDGIDVVRVAGDRIAEVWLFSADQAAEDAFWDAAG